MNAREVLTEVLDQAFGGGQDLADAALEALESSGYTVAKLEQVAWRRAAHGAMWLDAFDDPANEDETSEPLFRIVQVDDQEETK